MNPWNVFGVVMTGMGLLLPLCIGTLFIGAMAVAGVVIYRMSRRSATERRAAQSWPSVPGMVLSSSVQWRRGTDNRDEQNAVVIYQYEVNGKSYQGQTIKAGEQFLRVRMPGEDQAIVNRYPAGASVMVYYNPSKPEEAALER